MKNFIRNISHRFFIIWAGLNAWALAATAEQESLLISKIIGEVSPKSHLELTSNTNGNITLLTPNNTSITQGSLLAWVNKEQMDLVKEIDELQDLQQKAKGSGTVVREIESVENLRDTILQTQQELFFLENLLQSDDFELNEQELDITKKSIQLKSEFLKQFQASLEVYEQAIKNDSFTRLADLQKLVKDQESERRLAEFQLLSNGNGDLQWLVKNEQFVVSKQPVATITDASEIYIKIPSQAFEVTQTFTYNLLTTSAPSPPHSSKKNAVTTVLERKSTMFSKSTKIPKYLPKTTYSFLLFLSFAAMLQA